MHAAQAERVAEYYDRNTAPFLKWYGSGTRLGAIHREIWAEGFVNSAHAFEYLNRFVLTQLASLARDMHAKPQVLDLGCGIGGTCTWLAERFEAHFTGVTLSPVQCRWATERAAKASLARHCKFLTADMTQTALVGPFDLAYAIESLIHVADPEPFFVEAARLIRPGGYLILCDDFLAPGNVDQEPRSRWVATFKQGWHAFGLRTWQRTCDVANQHGFSLANHQDVTAHQRTAPPWLIHLGHALLQLPCLRGPYWDSLRGSTALQQCVRQHWVEYHVATFIRMS